MQPDVTFVIAAFNAEDSIATAVASALAQRGVTVEVVVVDDKSSDATIACVAELADERIVIVGRQENGGPGAARNIGLAVARGRWIAVLDADDAVEPDRMLRLTRRGDAAGAAAVVDDLSVVASHDASGRAMFGRERLERLGEMTLAGFIGGNLMFADTFSYGYMKPVFRRSFVEAHGLAYDETLRIGEDYIFLASLLALGGRCAVAPDAGYRYHLRAGSISRVLKLSHVEAMLSADAAFVAAHPLDGEAAAAQALRTRSLRRAASFLSLLGHIKDRAPARALATVIADPAALGHLRMPIAARFRRLAGRRQDRAEV